MGPAPAWARTGPALWLAATVIGLVLGVIGFLVAPLPPSGGASGSPKASSPAGSPEQSPSAGTPSATPGGESPPFTRAALLQTDELRGFGWGKADQTALYDSASKELPALCMAPKTIGAGAAEIYGAEYQGLQTHAVEIVVRHRSAADAADRFDRLADAAGDCADARGDRAATPTSKHQPRLGGVDDARWWQLKIPSDSVVPDRATRGTVAVARVDDRVVYLLLSSPTSDPASTVRFEPLLTQAARRMV